MAERRMFAKSVVLDDKFSDLPLSARVLYFTLGMEADDDGFVGAPRRAMRQCGVNKQALQVLIDAGYLRSFDGGVVYIQHWTTNNQIRKDRYRPSVYRKELMEVVFDAVPVNPV